MELIGKELLRDLVLTGDLYNTINGGRISAVSQWFAEPDHYLLTLKTPGIKGSNLRLEIKEKELHLFNMFDHSNSETKIRIPVLLKSLFLPKNVNLRGIKAVYKSFILNVYLPFNEPKNGYPEHIIIRHR